MRTVLFKDVLYGAARAAGMSPGTSDLNAIEAEELAQAINRRAREGWQYAMWPELMILEERFYRPAWDVTADYVVGDERYYDGIYYRALLDGAGQQPDTETTYWEEITDLDKYVPWTMAGYEDIGTVEGAWKNNPRLTATPYSLDFRPGPNGIEMEAEAGVSVWLKYRRRPNRFTSVEYSAAQAYLEGELCYYATTGECYKALQACTGQPPTDGTYWEKVDFPEVLEMWTVAAVRADWLRKEGQLDKAIAEDELALGELARTADVELSATRGGVKARFIGR